MAKDRKPWKRFGTLPIGTQFFRVLDSEGTAWTKIRPVNAPGIEPGTVRVCNALKKGVVNENNYSHLDNSTLVCPIAVPKRNVA